MVYCLRENEIHVWHAGADSKSSGILRCFLTPGEIKRADRYYFPRDRENFIASRGILRVLLGKYLNVQPDGINLHFNKYGKPFLKNCEGSLNFNVSHSNGKILLAFARNHEIGIDIEYIRPDFADLEIARHYFSASEILALSRLPEASRKYGFFSCWTRKEAYIKAKGRGLSIPLDSFDVSVCPDEAPELFSVKNNTGEIRKWKIFSLHAGNDYCASLAVKGNPASIKHFEWKEDLLNPSSELWAAVIRLQ